MATITFRNSKIVYYGPHECQNCGSLIAKMGEEWGGTAFTYPSGPIYPNTEWHPHVCDPHNIHLYKGKCAKYLVLQKHRGARAELHPLGSYWEIKEEGDLLHSSCVRHMDEAGAWISAYEWTSETSPAEDPRTAFFFRPATPKPE